MFHSFQEEYEWFVGYYTKFRKVPSKAAFKNKFPEFEIQAVNDSAHFAEEVVKSHTRHRLLVASKECADYIGSNDIEGAAKFMHAEIIKIVAEVSSGGDIDIISDWKAFLDEAAEKANRVNAGGFAGIPMGFESYDYKTGGAQPGEFHIVAARVAEGKSWLLMQWARTALFLGKKVQFNTLEMSRSQVAYRMHSLMSLETGQQLFSNLELQQGRNFDRKRYLKFLRTLRSEIKGALHVTDGSRGRVSPLTIAAQIERNSPDIVFIDYITLMEGAVGGDWKSIGALSGAIKGLAQQYQLPIVAAAQLNRQAIGKEPAGTETIAQADAIGQDADSVITVKKMSESVLLLKQAKNRHGPSNYKWFVEFRPGEGVMKEVSYEKAMNLKDADMDAEDAASEKLIGQMPAPKRVIHKVERPVRRSVPSKVLRTPVDAETAL